MKKNLLLILMMMMLLLTAACADEKSGKGSSGSSGDGGDWKESAKFMQEVMVDNTGTMKEQTFVIGSNGKLGIGGYTPFVAGQEQKTMWYFWGDKTTLLKPFKVDAIRKETGEKITAYEAIAPNSLTPEKGADHTMSSSIKLPEPGLWRLEVHFDNKKFSEVVIDVQEQSN